MRIGVSAAVVALGVCLGGSGVVLADVVSLTSDHDATLYEDPSGALANGSGQGFFAGTNLFAGTIRRGLVSFDVAGALPAGSTILSATITLNMSRTVALTETVTLHRALAAWGEGPSVPFGEGGGGAASQPGDATWLHTVYPGQFWASPGGDFDPTPSASLPIGGLGFYTWGAGGELVADVQGWLDAPGSNHGWAVLGNEAAATTAKRFDSRENITAANRPMLTIEYTPPCRADYNHDGFLDGIDYDLFNNDYENPDPEQQIRADYNGDGFVDGIDYDLFNNDFAAGC